MVTDLTASLWFRSLELTITSSTSKSRGPSNERKNMAAAAKQLESMVYRLTQERGRLPFLTPRLENATEKTREGAPLLVKQIWDFLEEQLEVAEKREMRMIRGLEEVVTCIYGPAVTFAFPDPLVTAYRYSVTHVSLIS